ncbi:hypothetical protein Nepgr_001976 [Nepenthes gracilis]|uniref:Uncharacterized protein n=1 Tax=Nepenthes gracilis TaxID=150966 RepID=A0AAD3RWG3_NEPGR|nr:hypothetical protein Nepgr_001976 [Nepenthes gracilis]
MKRRGPLDWDSKAEEDDNLPVGDPCLVEGKGAIPCVEPPMETFMRKEFGGEENVGKMMVDKILPKEEGLHSLEGGDEDLLVRDSRD